jgi:hypothetical protein
MSHLGNTIREEQIYENRRDNMKDFVLDIFIKAVAIDERNIMNDNFTNNVYLRAEDLPDNMIHELMNIVEKKYEEQGEK